MKNEFVYLLTIIHPRQERWQLAGVFLDPSSAKAAMKTLVAKGVDEDLLGIDHAPIGIIDLDGIDQPYEESLLN